MRFCTKTLVLYDSKNATNKTARHTRPNNTSESAVRSQEKAVRLCAFRFSKTCPRRLPLLQERTPRLESPRLRPPLPYFLPRADRFVRTQPHPLWLVLTQGSSPLLGPELESRFPLQALESLLALLAPDPLPHFPAHLLEFLHYEAIH